MITGRDTLDRLARAAEEASQRAAEIERTLGTASERIVELDAQRAEKLRALAEVRLGALTGGAIAERMNDTDAQALDFLRQRRDRLDELGERRAALDAKIRELNSARREAADALERASLAVDEAEAETQRRLSQDEGYEAQLAAAEDAERVAVHADEKASMAEAELADKGKAYRDDPLFMYLWERNYATPDYRPGGGPLSNLIRWLDGKVAAMVRFDRARADYVRLSDLPLRLREHADRVGTAADAAVATVERIEAQAREADGIPALDAAVDEANAALEEAELAVEKVVAERASVEEQVARFAAGEDEGMRDIARFLSSEFGRDDLASLRRDALATPFPEDDALVAELLDLEEQRARTEATLSELKQAAERSRERVGELRRLQTTFKRERFDAPGSSFPDADVIATLLAQVVAGSIRGDSLWRVLQRQHRYRPPASNPTFGSGRLGGGGAWTGGAPRGLPSGRSGTTGGVAGGVAGGIAGALGGLASASKAGRGSFGGTRRAGRGSPGGFKTGGRF